MKAVFLSLSIACLILVSSFTISFQDRYDQAMIYCEEVQPSFNTIANSYGLDYREVLPIAFPECVRYSSIKDEFEVLSLEYVYTQLGKDGADFSVGHFQMKPSFLEQIENGITQLEGKQILKDRFAYSIRDVKKQRAERIARLTNDKWQIHYLCAFFTLMEVKYQEEEWTETVDKINFYAAAYNYGFNSKKEEIKNWQTVQAFPYGDGGEKEAYSTIASSYYNKITKHE